MLCILDDCKGAGIASVSPVSQTHLSKAAPPHTPTHRRASFDGVSFIALNSGLGSGMSEVFFPPFSLASALDCSAQCVYLSKRKKDLSHLVGGPSPKQGLILKGVRGESIKREDSFPEPCSEMVKLVLLYVFFLI